MKMTTTQLSKQDYLKKYLSGGDEKKKKKRKKVTTNSIIKSKIIDDDIDLKNMKAIDSDELEVFDLAEEAPQIVGIVDDRPEEVRLMSEYKNTKKWRIVADEHGIDDVKVTAITEDKPSESGKQTEKEKPKKDAEKSKARKTDGKDEGESDPSPPRKIKKEKSDSDASPPRKSNKDRDSDNSPPRKSRKAQDSPPRKIKKEKSDSDASPPRKSRKQQQQQQQHSPVRRIKKEKSDSDASPPRKSNSRYDLDPSPPRRSKRNYDSDQSPKRRARRSNRRRSEDSDSSPPPPPRSSKRRTRERDATRRDGKRRKSPDARSSRRESGKSVSRASENGPKKNRDESPQEPRSKNTLGGKKSGLQNADELRKEIEELKEREKEMKANASGRNEAVVVRDRKTGLRIDPKEEARKRREKEEKEAEKMSQYAVWGKGVKQVQDGQEKLRDDLYEMSKPLARYADDKDLDDMLKSKEWDGDPMLDYIRKKRKRNKAGEDGTQKPQYEGAYLPNRYGIRPGHRWDGVDRSNGYEKKWFEEQNAKKAREEEAFKWSTADM